MKGKLIKISFLLASAVTFLMADEVVNLLKSKNSGFETSTLTGWNATPYKNNAETDTAEATMKIDTTSGTAKYGKGFLRITVTKVTAENWHIQLLDPAWTAQVGFTYYYSAWVRADASQQVQISVYGEGSDQYKYRTSSDFFTLDTAWQQINMMFTADTKGAGVHNFALVLGGAKGVYDIDSVEITEMAPSVGGSIYQNGDFELGGTGWNLQVEGTGAAAVTHPTEGAKSGSKFCRVTVTALPESEKPYQVQLQDESWTCQKGGLYTFEFYAKADNDTSKIQIIAQTGQSRNYETIGSKDENLTKEWKKYILSFEAEDIAGLDSVNVNITCGYNLGVYDFDSMSLTMAPVSVRQSRLAAMNRTQQFTIHILPGQLQCVLNDNRYVNKINIHDVMGRVFYSGSFAGNKAGSYILPRPASGTWIVKVNSDKSEQLQKIVLP